MKVSEIDFFMKPTLYLRNKEVDNTGPETRKKMEKMLDLKSNKIYLIGDTENGFSNEYMDVLSEEIFDNGKTLEFDSIDFEEGTTEFKMVSTVYGVILKVFTLSLYEASYYADRDTMVEIEDAIIN